MNYKNKKRNAFLLIGAVLLIALCLLFFQNFFKKNGARVIIMQDGEVLCELSLDETLQGDEAMRLESAVGYNLLEIKDGAASITSADCPDGLCVKQKAISKQGESLICLPHKLVITVEGAEENVIDSFAY